MFNYYTPDQANKILPEIKKRFNRILDKRNEIIKIQKELNSFSENQSFYSFFEKKNRLNNTITLLYKEIQEIEEHGILIKSVDDGLLDFPSKRFDEEVWLCWRNGEEKIRFWHGKHEGFRGRKPLSFKGTYNEDDLNDLK
jgi:hypothetical protein